MNNLVLLLKLANFKLSGSRRMADKFPKDIVISESTDWDFYCDDTMDNIAILEENGFIEVFDKQNYFDDCLLRMFKHENYAIDVLIRRDIKLYENAFESISKDLYIDKLWKSSPKRNPNISKPEFQLNVRNYFNSLYILFRNN